MLNLLDYSFEEIEKLVEDLGEKKFRASQLYSALYSYKNSNEISVVVALNEELNDARLITFTDDLKYNQELIMKIRAQNKKNYQEKNNLFSK